MSVEEQEFREIFRRLETTDRHIVDIKNDMLVIQKDVDEKFNTLNTNMLKILGGRANNGAENANAPWIRQSVGLFVAVVTLLAFLIPTFWAMVNPVWITMESQKSQFETTLNHLQKDLSHIKLELKEHRGIPLHKGAGVALARNDMQFRAIDKDATLLIEEFRAMRGELSNLAKKLEGEMKVINERVGWTEQQILDKDKLERETYHKRFIEGGTP